MLKIRFIRIGRRGRPYYRLVLTEGQRSVKSKYIELLGSLDPRDKKNTTTLKIERIKHWLGHGAQLSPTAHNILVGRRVVSGPKRKATKLRKKQTAESSVAGKKEVTSEAKPEVKK